MTEAPARALLLERLRRLRRRRLLLEAAAALAAGLFTAVAAGVLAVGLEALLYLSSPWRWVLILAAAGAAAAAAARILWPWRGGLSLRAAALAIEDRAPELSQRLMTALEAGGGPRARLYSSDLLAASASEAAALLDRHGEARLVPASRLRRTVLRGAAIAGPLLLLLGLSGTAGGEALHRCLNPGTAFERPQLTRLHVEPGHQRAIRGEDVALSIRIEGDLPPALRVRRRDARDGDWVEEEVLLEAGGPDSLRHLFEEVRSTFDFEVAAGDGEAGPYRVTVIDPPEVTRLSLRYDYPEYSGLPPRVEDQGGDVRALAGTVVEWGIHASKPLSAAALVIDDTLRLPAQVVDDGAAVSWTLPAPEDSARARREYLVALTDRGGVGNRAPIRHALRVLRDQPPEVVISEPGPEADLPESQQVRVRVEAADDFGVSRVDLVFRVGQGPERRRPIPVEGGPRVVLSHLWDLAPLELLPEDRVRYRAEAFDNDAVGGPKRAVSPEHVLRFPSLWELFDEVSRQQEERLESLEEVAAGEAGAREYVERLRREVLRTEELTWDQKQELESALAAEEERARAVEEVARQMAGSLEKLEQGGADSRDLLDKLDEIRELMAAVASPELLEALRAVQQAAEQPDAEELAEALKQFAQDQEAFQQRLDRTLDLLRQVHAEQRLLAVVEQAEDLEERQGRINEALEQSSAEAALGDEALRDQEGRLAGDTDRLRREIDRLGQELRDLSARTSESLSSEAEEMEQQALSERMRRMERLLASGQRPQAGRMGAGLQQDLEELSASMRQLREEFFGDQRQELARLLRRAMADLVDLSRRQEELAQDTSRQPGGSDAALAAGQQALAQGAELVTEDVARAGSRTLALEPSLAATLGGALRRMEEAAGRLGQLERGRAGQLQTEAMGYLNQAAQQLRRSLDNLSQARTPSSFGEAMEQLMALSEQQAALNEATRQAMQQGSRNPRGPGGRIPAMPGLAAEQRRLQQALAEVERSLRGQRSLQERIGAIQQEMKEVLARMERLRADARVTEGQERVLQRLLDASRSIHSRGFEKRRHAEQAEQRSFAGPGWLPVDLGQRPEAWREAMRRALAADYPAEYRELIRRYYESVYQDLHQEDGPEALP